MIRIFCFFKRDLPVEGLYQRNSLAALQPVLQEISVSHNGNGGGMARPLPYMNINLLLSYDEFGRYRFVSELVGNGELTVRGRKIVNILVDPDIKRKPGCLDAAAVSQTGSPSFAIVKVSSP